MARNLTAQPRTETGKNNNNRLRVEGFVPVTMYSHGKAESLKVNAKEFSSVFGKHISESVIVDLAISNGDKCHVIVKDYQRDPVTEQLLHLDFYKVTAGEKIKTSVPVEIVGSPIGVRSGGVFEVIDRMLLVECLPLELPEKISIDVTALEIDQGIHIKDIPTPPSMKILLDPEHIIAHVTTVREEKIETKVAEVAAEGAAPAEGDAAKKDEAAAKGADKK